MTLHSVLIQKLLSSNAHLTKSAGCNHHLKQFVYGIRNSQAIIDSDRTLVCLRHAMEFIAALARDRHSRFLFVNTNPIFNDIVESMTRTIGVYTPRDNIIWRKSGFMTNSFSPKKFKSRNKKFCLGLAQHPDCVVVLDTELKSSVIREADKMQIPIVGLVNPTMPWEYYKKISYPIPANDSMEFVYLFCNIITKTILLEKKKLKGLKEEISKEDANVSEGSIQSQRMVEIDGEIRLVLYDKLDHVPIDAGETNMIYEKIALVQINDKLGSRMGFDGPMSSVELRDDLTPLDCSVNHIKTIKSKHGCNVPLLLVNSENTDDNTKMILGKHQLPFVDTILTTQIPSREESLEKEIDSESFLSGHTAVILSLIRGGTLDLLISQGKEYAYISQADNIGSSVDLKILSHLMDHKIDCCMEVIPKTPFVSSFSTDENTAMIKLGSILRDHKLNSPMTENVKFIDTRNLWVNLNSLKKLVETESLKAAHGDDIAITGPAVNLFDQTIALSVPQSRFQPLNSTSDLLLLKSDLYRVEDGALVRNTAGSNPYIDLGPEFEKLDEFQMRFKSIPSLVNLDCLNVAGDVWFGSEVTLKGKVNIIADFGTRLEIPDGAVIDNQDIHDPTDIL